MDILRILSSPDLEVRKKSLELVVDLMTSRNCEEVSQRDSCKYVRNHVVFGIPDGSFPAVIYKNMNIWVDLMETLCG